MVSPRGEPIPLAQFFAGRDPRSRDLFDAVCSAIMSVGEATIRVTKSEVVFRRRRGFAWVWLPAQYLRGEVAPLVLTIALRRRDDSPRWKQVVEARPERFTHHLELRVAADLDEEILARLREAWAAAA